MCTLIHLWLLCLLVFFLSPRCFSVRHLNHTQSHTQANDLLSVFPRVVPVDLTVAMLVFIKRGIGNDSIFFSINFIFETGSSIFLEWGTEWQPESTVQAALSLIPSHLSAKCLHGAVLGFFCSFLQVSVDTHSWLVGCGYQKKWPITYDVSLVCTNMWPFVNKFWGSTVVWQSMTLFWQ